MPKSDVQITLGLDTAPFAAAMDKTQKMVQGATAGITKALGFVAGGFMAFKSGQYVWNSFSGAVEAGKKLDQLSRQTGVAAGQIKLMQYALDRADVSTEDTADILSTLRNNLALAGAGAGEYAGTLRRVGLDYGKLQGMDLPAQFEAIAGAVNRIKEPMQRNALSAKLLGEAGSKAAAQFQQGDLARASAQFGKNAAAMGAAAPQLALAANSWKRITEVGNTVWETLVAKFAPLIDKVAGKLESFIPAITDTISSWVDSAWEFVNVIYDAFKAGTLWDMVKLGLQIAAMTAVDFFAKGMMGAVAATGEILGQVFSTLVEPDFWAGFWQAFSGLGGAAIMSAGAMFLKVFETPIKYIDASFTYLFSWMIKGFENVWNAFIDMGGKATGLIYEGMAKVAGIFSEDLAATLKDAAGQSKIVAEGYKIAESEAMSFADALKTAKPGLFGLSADEMFAEAKASVDDITKGGAKMGKAIGGNINPDAILKQFQEGFAKAGFFGPEIDKKMAEFSKMLGGMERGGIKGRTPGAAPGTMKDAVSAALTTVQTKYDELRRIGGGMGTAAQNAAVKQVDLLTQIRDILKTTGGGAKFSGKTASRNFSFEPVG